MEPFFDGGLFELIIAIGIGVSLNFIFKNKILLILYSIVSILIPVLYLIVHKKEFYLLFVGISIFNSLLFIILLWKLKFSEPNKSLFETDKYLDMLFKKKTQNFKHKNNPVSIDKVENTINKS